MRNIALFTATVLLGCACAVGQIAGATAMPDVMGYQQSGQVEPPPGGAPPNVFFHTQKIDGKITTGYIAIADSAKPVTGAPYTATAITETTQVLADGNRIVNKTESQLARDSQGRTRRQEMTSNLGPLATNAPKIAFINDPVDKVSYVLDLNDKTAQVIKTPAGPHTFTTATGDVPKPLPPGAGPVTMEKRIIVAGGATPGVEQRVWVNTAGSPSESKTESLGTQTIEGVSAVGTRTTRTIPAGEIGNERPLEITSEVWTSPDLQMVVLSKRNDPRIGETVYRLTNIQRADPDPSLFQVPSGFTTRQGPEFSTRQVPD
jgi:hypothetical protein